MISAEQMAEDERLALQLQREEINHLPENARAPLLNRLESSGQVQENIRQDLDDVREQSPRLLALYLIYAAAELITTLVILNMTWDTPCDKPLRWFVLIYSCRFIVQGPLVVYRYMIARSGGNPETARDISRWLEIVTFGWWIVGQVWLYTSISCHSTNATLFTYALVLVIIRYVALLLPLLFVLGICICLPCVLLVIRLLSQPPGAPDDIIQSLPRRTYDRDAAADNNNSNNNNNNNNDNNSAGDKPLCAVCRNDYQFGDELRSLPCHHEFHVDCVDPWLKIKKTCPLCRHDITLPANAASAAQHHDEDEQNGHDMV